MRSMFIFGKFKMYFWSIECKCIAFLPTMCVYSVYSSISISPT